jgi:hypothetical protein
MEHYMKKRKLWQQKWKDAVMEEYKSALSAAVSSLDQTSKLR